MTVVTTTVGTATADGLDASLFNAAATAVGVGTAAGFAAFVHGVDVASDVPDALRLEIVTTAGTQIVNDLVSRRNLAFSVEHNGSGSISFETDLSVFSGGLDDAALDPTNLARVHFGDLTDWPYGVAEGYIAAVTPAKDDSGKWVVTVACPGSWDVLDFGLIWPPIGAAGDKREFSYTAGMTGPSWVPEQWGTPVGKNVKDSFRWKEHRWPANWPESQSQWLWSPDGPDHWSGISFSAAFFGVPLVSVKQFVGQFTLVAAHDVEFNVAGDDTLDLYLNGALLKSKGAGAWQKTASFVRHLPAGTYVVAASVGELFTANGKNGFLCAVARLNNKGEVAEWLLRSSPSTFQVKTAGGYFAQVPLPPDGWYPAAVLWRHVGEAAARGVDFHPQVTLTFDNVKDSEGSAWVVKGPVEYDIGMSGAALGEEVRALGIDAAMLPGLRLSAWRDRGFDLRSRVVISKPKGAAWSSRTWSRVRTVALTHQEAGWTETAGDAALSTTYGRREVALSGGGLAGDVQADDLATSAMGTSASPEETIQVEITSANTDGPQPFRDFNVADTILVETVGGFTAMKVMTIAGAEQDDKSVLFTISGYPVD